MGMFSGLFPPLWQQTEYILVVDKTFDDVILALGNTDPQFHNFLTFYRPNNYLMNGENNQQISQQWNSVLFAALPAALLQ